MKVIIGFLFCLVGILLAIYSLVIGQTSPHIPIALALEAIGASLLLLYDGAIP